MGRVEPAADLLFGMLALQSGFIDQGTLFSAFHAWLRKRGRSLREILDERGAVDATRRGLIEGLVAEHLEAIGSTVVDDDADATASFATKPARYDETAPFRSTGRAGVPSSPWFRFQILRDHARGGLGRVHVALDTELNREVALKQLLDHHADNPSSRSRFVREAEITGGLEHPGIVPVYGLGRFEDDRPYYAMRFIRGDTLKDAIERHHRAGREGRDPAEQLLEFRKLLRNVLDACNAVDYAHDRGVIHRDIKPSNILIGKHGETLVVDWGLAKSVGRPDDIPDDERTLVPQSGSGSPETLPGSALGTPAYMSPEQAVGDLERVGPASDVYSLGATLYYSLTGRPPFEGDLEAVLRDVEAGRFQHPRAVDREIPADLEAICLKAMALDPADRYESPRELAEDVERWMADEPVGARPEPIGDRLRRRMLRHRTAAAAVAAALVVASIGLSLVLGVQARSRRTLAEANRREQARFELALKAIRDYRREVENRPIFDAPSFREVRDGLFRRADSFYRELGGQLALETVAGNDRRRARVAYEQGELCFKYDDIPDAATAHEEALRLRREIARGSPADPTARLDLARSLIAVGTVLDARNRPDKADALLDEAVGLVGTIPASESTDDHAHRAVLAWCHERIGLWLAGRARVREAIAALDRSKAIREQILDSRRPTGDPRPVEMLANNRELAAVAFEKLGRLDDARQAREQARSIRSGMGMTAPKPDEWTIQTAPPKPTETTIDLKAVANPSIAPLPSPIEPPLPVVTATAAAPEVAPDIPKSEGPKVVTRAVPGITVQPMTVVGPIPPGPPAPELPEGPGTGTGKAKSTSASVGTNTGAGGALASGLGGSAGKTASYFGMIGD